jgi:hypothetical protein
MNAVNITSSLSKREKSRRKPLGQALDFASNVPDNLVEHVIRNNANGDSWKNIPVIYNGSGQGRDLTVTGNWIVVANDQRAGSGNCKQQRTEFTSNHFHLSLPMPMAHPIFDMKPCDSG